MHLFVRPRPHASLCASARSCISLCVRALMHLFVRARGVHMNVRACARVCAKQSERVAV